MVNSVRIGKPLVSVNHFVVEVLADALVNDVISDPVSLGRAADPRRVRAGNPATAHGAHGVSTVVVAVIGESRVSADGSRHACQYGAKLPCQRVAKAG